jgi:hypothetical protein
MPTVALTRPDGVQVNLTLAQAVAGPTAKIGIAAAGATTTWHTVGEGADFTEAGFTVHVLKIWLMPTPATDAVDLVATPVG